MTTLLYIATWLLLPFLAIEHKLRRVTHYEITSEKLVTLKCKDRVEADHKFQALQETNRYGNYMKMVMFSKNKEPVTITKIVW